MSLVRESIRRRFRRSRIRWFMPNRVSRVEIIQECMRARGGETYLEIGVSQGHCFKAVQASRKVGVDPIPPAPDVLMEAARPGVSYHQCTSDVFFAREAARALPTGVDVVFIDGLHTADQAYRDCINALGMLRPGGIVLLHDCLPSNATEATPARSKDEAAEINGPTWDLTWTGDVWKTIVALRVGHKDIVTNVLNTDHGIGIVRRGINRCALRMSSDALGALRFSDLMRNRSRLLGLRVPAGLWLVLAEAPR